MRPYHSHSMDLKERVFNYGITRGRSGVFLFFLLFFVGVGGWGGALWVSLTCLSGVNLA